jgi:hypothetical protein
MARWLAQVEDLKRTSSKDQLKKWRFEEYLSRPYDGANAIDGIMKTFTTLDKAQAYAEQFIFREKEWHVNSSREKMEGGLNNLGDLRGSDQ